MEIRDLNEILSFSKNGVTKKIVFNTKEALCFILNLLPGQTIPVHRHENAVLIANILSGACEVTVNQDQYELQKGHAFMVKGEDEFGIPLVKSDVSIYVILSPNPTNPEYAREHN